MAGVEGTPPWYYEYGKGDKYLFSKSLIGCKNSGRGDITPLIGGAVRAKCYWLCEFSEGVRWMLGFMKEKM